jgi:hypothetical protein
MCDVHERQVVQKRVMARGNATPAIDLTRTHTMVKGKAPG